MNTDVKKLKSLSLPKLEMKFASIVALYRICIAFFSMLVFSFFGLLSFIITLGYSKKFFRLKILPHLCKFALLISGIKLKIDPQIKKINEKKMFIFNHNSFLDIFIIPALGLENSNYLISEGVRNILPLHWTNLLCGAKYVPVEKDKNRRLNFFKKLTDDFSNNNERLICSVEGQHYFYHGISKFKRGVFHVAMKSNVKIVPLFINIKEENNPFESYYYRSGIIKVELLDEIDPSKWELKNLDDEISKVRNKYVSFFNKVHNEEIE